jgi:hypothetical protein
MKRWILGWLFACGAGLALASDPAGEKAIHDYTLTMTKVRAWAEATQAFNDAAMKSPALAEEANGSGGSNDTLAQTIASFDHHPKLYAFYAAKGISKEEAALVPLAVQGGCSVAAYPQLAQKMATMTSPAQVAFCKANLAEIRKLKVYGLE